MGLAQFIIPVEQRIKLKVSAPREHVLNELKASISGAPPLIENPPSSASKRLSSEQSNTSSLTRFSSKSDEPSPEVFSLDGKILRRKSEPDLVRFQFTRQSSFVRKLFQPKVIGEVRTVADGQSEIELNYVLSGFSRRLINGLVSAIIGGLIGVLAASYLVLDAPSLFAIAVHSLPIPALISLVAIVITKWIVSQDEPLLLDAFMSKFENCIVSSPPKYADISPFLISKTALQGFFIATAILFGAFIWHMYAYTYWASARYEQCEKMCSQVSTVCRFILGDKNPAVADANYYTAECLRAQGKNAEADKLYNEALDIFRAQVGAKHITIGDTLFNLGRAYEGEGKLKEAEDSYRKSIEVYESLPSSGGGTNIWFARIRDRLGMIRLKQRDYSGAYSEENKALGIDIRYGSSGGRSVGEDYNNLGVVAFRQKHFDQAEKYLLDSISEKSKDDREKAYSLGVSQLNLARVFEATGRTAQAESLRKEALTAWSKYLAQNAIDPVSAYKLILQKDTPNYEKEAYDTRSEALIDGPSRI